MTSAQRRGELWAADLDSADPLQAGGRLRNVLVLQTDALNDAGHPTAVVVPCSLPGDPPTRGDGFPLRLMVPTGGAVQQPLELLVDQLRAIDRRRLRQRVHTLPPALLARVEQALQQITGP